MRFVRTIALGLRHASGGARVEWRYLLSRHQSRKCSRTGFSRRRRLPKLRQPARGCVRANRDASSGVLLDAEPLSSRSATLERRRPQSVDALATDFSRAKASPEI